MKMSVPIYGLLIAGFFSACKPQGTKIEIPNAPESGGLDDNPDNGPTDDGIEVPESQGTVIPTTPPSPSVPGSGPLPLPQPGTAPTAVIPLPEVLIASGEKIGKWVMLSNVEGPSSCLDFGYTNLAESSPAVAYPCRRYQAENQTVRIVATEVVNAYQIQSNAPAGPWCLKASANADAAAVQLAKCVASEGAQRWTVTAAGNAFTFTSETAKRSIVMGANRTLSLSTSNPTGTAQHWAIYTPSKPPAAPADLITAGASSGTAFRIKNVAYSTTCINMSTAAEKVDLALTSCKTPADSHQQWKLVSTPVPNSYMIQSILSDAHCIRADSLAIYSQIRSAKCDQNDPTLRWFVVADSGSYHFISDFMAGVLHWGAGDKLQIAEIGKTENAQKWTYLKP